MGEGVPSFFFLREKRFYPENATTLIVRRPLVVTLDLAVFFFLECFTLLRFERYSAVARYRW